MLFILIIIYIDIIYIDIKMQNCNQRLIESDPKMLKSFNASAKLHQQLSKE